MTSEQKMQTIVEAAGECWHDWEWIPGGGKQCKNCDIDLYHKDSVSYNQRIPVPPNPSPTDLNELFRLAGNISYIKFGGYFDEPKCQLWTAKFGYINGRGKTKAEALLNALYESVKGER